MPENIKNFLNSRDNLYDDFGIGKKLIMYCFLLFFVLLEVIFFALKIQFIGKKTGILDLIFAIFFAICGLVNFIVGCKANPVQNHCLHYGIIFLLLSCYVMYIAFRMALFPLSEWYGLIGIAFWALLSVLCIFGIKSNIKHDYYCENNKKTVWISDKNPDAKCGIVLTRYTLIGIGILIASEIVLILLYFLFFPELFTAGDVRFSRIWQIIIIFCLFGISYMAHFSWKLVIKQFYIHKYGVHMEIDDTV